MNSDPNPMSPSPPMNPDMTYPTGPPLTRTLVRGHSASTSSPSPSVCDGPGARAKALEEGHQSTPSTRHPANPPPKPRSCPRMQATHPPARHTSPHNISLNHPNNKTI
ncbi:hypothetical protein ILYODFUR_025125 [Ilyodon furcidens]|uniref:Uncharacterized protein n=1 Tax=Ilyodon furcidens TaxID=33524 RepID=A0ABV0UMZ4_9TELE